MIGVVGSRNFTDYAMLSSMLNYTIEDGWPSEDDDGWRPTLVSGGAEGADSLAARFAREHGLGLIEHLPDFERYGYDRPGTLEAYFQRNSLIVRDASVLIAFFGPGQPPSVNKSGTMDTVRKAFEKRIPIYIKFQHE
jgi:hypothetical protein